MIAAMSTVRLWRMPMPSASSPASSRTRTGLRSVGSMRVSFAFWGADHGKDASDRRGDRVILRISRGGAESMENRNRQVLLKRRPTGAPTTEDFEIADRPMPDPGDGGVLVRGIYLSLDPYMRGRMSAARSYARPVDVGAVMEGRVVGQVVRSLDPSFREGDYVLGGYGWQLYSTASAQDLAKLDPAEAPLSTALGVLGMPGLTAYVGLSEIGRPQRRETVVI